MTATRARGGNALRLRADLLLVCAAALWGTAFYFQKSAMAHIGPMLFVGLRSLISALALAPFALRETRIVQGSTSGIVGLSAGGGLAFFAGGVLQQAGLVTATVINASFLTALYVVVTPLLFWIVYRRTPQPLVWAGIAVAFIGSWLLGGGTIGGFSSGDWLVAASALGWAVHILVTEKAARTGRPILYTALSFAVVALIALPIAALTETIDPSAILAAGQSLLFVGLLSGALSFAIMAVALRHSPPAEATVIMSMEMLFAALAGYLLLGERLQPIGWLGAALIFCAVLIVQFGRLRRA